MKVHRIDVHLAAFEWGNELMEQVALGVIKAHRDPYRVLAMVHEHGGWWLEFVLHPREKGHALCVGSANDCAIFSGEAARWREKVSNAAESNTLDLIREPDIFRGEPQPAPIPT